MPTYNVSGQEIHTVEAGPPARQKAILIHGWSSSSYAMTPLVQMLSRRFHVISVDLPGYGASPRLNKPISIQAYADLMAEFAEQISDGAVIVVGHSMGGMIALNMAMSYPVLIERMVLIAPTITGRLSNTVNTMISPVTMMERFGLGQVLVSAVEGVYVGITDRLMRPVSFADRTVITEEEYSRLRADARRPGQGRVRAECFFAMRDNDLRGRVGRVEVPSLVIWGAEDNTVPLRDASVVADEWPQADLRILPKAGHWPHFEAPEITRRLVAANLGLPQLSDALEAPVGDETLVSVREISQFLGNSSIGEDMNLLQRTRLSGQLRQYKYPPYRSVVDENNDTHEMFIIQSGSVEVWTNSHSPGEEEDSQPRRVSSLKPGEMTGELSMIDDGIRTADLISGPEGATVLGLNRERMRALVEDDPELGSKLLWNIIQVMAQRVRFILWQLQRATAKQQMEQEMWEAEREQQQRELASRIRQ